MLSLYSCGGPQKENKNDTNQANDAVQEAPLNGLDKISEWKRASDNQKSTFSEQYVIIANKEPGSKIDAKDMKDCLEEAIRSLESTNELTISEVASGCVDMIRQLNPSKL